VSRHGADAPRVVHADPSGLSGPLAVAAARAASADGREAAVALRTLAAAGLVAVRTAHGVLELHEALDGWSLVPSHVPTPDVDDLVTAAAWRARRLAAERNRGAPPDDATHDGRMS
jgi:hypothetical protein